MYTFTKSGVFLYVHTSVCVFGMCECIQPKFYTSFYSILFYKNDLYILFLSEIPFPKTD